jgi:hypothetical protein
MQQMSNIAIVSTAHLNILQNFSFSWGSKYDIHHRLINQHSCYSYSCSQKCFVVHKETCNPEVVNAAPQRTEPSNLEFQQSANTTKEVPVVLQGIARVENIYETQHDQSNINPLRIDQLARLDTDTQTQLALGSDELRTIIHTINSAEDPAWRSAMLQQQLRDNPNFMEFVEHIMSVSSDGQESENKPVDRY